MRASWSACGGWHPRSLEYLDALLSGGTARYRDVTARLDAAVNRRLGGEGRDRWLAARTGLDAALAETVALAAGDVLLDDLLARLAEVTGAPGLLLGVPPHSDAHALTRRAPKMILPTYKIDVQCAMNAERSQPCR